MREVLPFSFFDTFQSFSCDILQRESLLPPPPRSVYRFPAGLATRTQHASPLGSATHSASCCQAEETPPSRPPQSLLLPISCPHSHRQGTGGLVGAGGGAHVMTEVSAWVTVILSAVVPTGPGKSMHSSPVRRLHQSALLCSQDSHSWPPRAPTVRPSRGSGYTVMGKKEVRVNAPLL